MSKIMTLAEVQTWLANVIPAVVKQVQDELMLIEQAERRKHKHFSKEKINETMSNLPKEMRDEMIAKVHSIADSRNITLRPGDCSSDKFIQLMVEQVHISVHTLKRKFGDMLPDGVLFDAQGRCTHDIECDQHIENSLEYITELICKHEKK